MNKGNIELVVGGTFVALPGMGADIDFETENPPVPKIPGVDPRLKEFADTFDELQLETIRAAAPEYKPMSGRLDPFTFERMKAGVGEWSAVTRRIVYNFKDACDHALAVCAMWREEDLALQEITARQEKKKAVKEAEAKTRILMEGTKEFEVEQARLAWRDAVRKRNEALRLLDADVTAKRLAYRTLRDS